VLRGKMQIGRLVTEQFGAAFDFFSFPGHKEPRAAKF